MVEWMFHNGDHIPFLRELKEMGRETQLDQMPVLSEAEQELWQMYCFTGDNVLQSVDVYADRIGLPFDWDFENCVLLIANMVRKRNELEKLKRDNG